MKNKFSLILTSVLLVMVICLGFVQGVENLPPSTNEPTSTTTTAPTTESKIFCDCHCMSVGGNDVNLEPAMFNEQDCEGIVGHNCLAEEGSKRAQLTYDSCITQEAYYEEPSWWESFWDWIF